MSRCLIVCLAAALWPFFLSTTPAHAATHQRYDLVKEDGSNDRYIICDDSAPDGYQSQGEIVGAYKFLIVRLPHKQADIVVYRHGHILYHIADQRVEASGEWTPPGQTWKAYDFYLSPDCRYLFVQHGICNDTAVGYLYQRVGQTQWRPVRPGHLRLDWAALCYYAARHGEDAYKLGSATFVTSFDRWVWTRKAHAVVFSTGAASFWELREPGKGDLVAAYQITYNLRTGRFSHIVLEQM